jgi:Domain of unknown function (DUF5753)
MVSTGDSVEMYDVRGPSAFDQLMKLEQEATQIFLNQPLFVPGLLQVAGYAAEMISRIAGLKPGDPELTNRVNVRMQRADAFEKRLQGTTPPHLWAAIDEAVLRRVVGGPEVMREQLDHLITMSEMDTVHLGIIPLNHGAHVGLGGSFEVHEVASGEVSVFFEGAPADEIVGTDQALARRYRETMETMMASAVSGAEARALLETVRTRHDGGITG